MPAGRGSPSSDMASGFAENLTKALEMEGHETQLMSSDKLEEYLGRNTLKSFQVAKSIHCVTILVLVIVKILFY